MWDYHFFYAEKQLVKFRVSGFEFGVSGFGFRLEALNRLCSFVFCLLSKVKGLETVDNSTIQRFNSSTIQQFLRFLLKNLLLLNMLFIFGHLIIKYLISLCVTTKIQFFQLAESKRNTMIKK